MTIHHLMPSGPSPEDRRALARLVQEAIELLDYLGGEPDDEPDADDEPWLGAPEPRRPGTMQFPWTGRLAAGDGEADDADLEDGHDREPTLGAPERHPWRPHSFGWAEVTVDLGAYQSQAYWASCARGRDEAEVENEHGGDILDEPHDEDCDLEDAGDAEHGDGRRIDQVDKLPTRSFIDGGAGA